MEDSSDDDDDEQQQNAKTTEDKEKELTEWENPSYLVKDLDTGELPRRGDRPTVYARHAGLGGGET